MDRQFIFALLTIVSGSFVLTDCLAVPECMSGLCLRGSLHDLPTEAQVKRLIGSSRDSKPSMPHRKSSCLNVATSKHKKVYAHLTYINVESKWRLISITVASHRLCNNPETLSVDYELTTEKSIGLGSRIDNIIAAYGKPTYLLDSPSRELISSYFPDAAERDAYTIMQYVSGGDDLLTTRFFLLRGLVVGIDISADE